MSKFNAKFAVVGGILSLLLAVSTGEAGAPPGHDCSSYHSEDPCNTAVIGCHWVPGWFWGGTCEEGGSNHPPIAEDDSKIVDVNTSIEIDVLENDSDPDSGDFPIISSVSVPTYGTAVINSGKITYTPNAGFVGTDTFTYVISDERGGTDTAVVSLRVIEIVENADDLCYEPLQTGCRSTVIGMCMCMNIGPCGGGMGCMKRYPLRNVGEQNLTDVTVNYDETGMGGSIGSDCGVDPEGEGTCTTQSDVDFGPAGILGQTTEFDLDQPIPPLNDANNSVWVSNFAGGSCFVGSRLYGSYVKDGKLYRGKLKPCDNVDHWVGGPFDAWDTFRDNSDEPPSDRNISTKVVNAPFSLSLASLNMENNGYEIKSGGGEIKVAVYRRGTSNRISNVVTFDPTTSAHVSSSPNLTVSHASPDAIIGFKFCATYKYNVAIDKHLYTLYDPSWCSSSNTIEDCNSTTGNDPAWHLCRAGDNFAVRPKSFDVNITNGDTLIAGKPYSLKFTANTQTGGATPSYDEEQGTSFDVSLVLANTNPNCAHQTASLAPDVNFTDGEYENNSSFDRVGDFNLTIEESNTCTHRFAKVDCGDREVPGHWVVESDLPIEPKKIGISLIPDHFDALGVLKDHHHSATHNFTYLSNFGNNSMGDAKQMSAEYNATVTARKGDNSIASNYTAQCFAKDVNVTIKYEIIDTSGNTVSLSPSLSKIQYFERRLDINDSYFDVALGTDINYTLPADMFDANISGTANPKFNFNFDRSFNRQVNPFILHLKSIKIGNSPFVAIDKNSTFLSARAVASKSFYDDVGASSIKTPVMVEIYCDKWPASTANCPEVDVIGGQTNDHKWWISRFHDINTYQDGRISLSATNGGVSPSILSIDTPENGIDTNISVSGSAPVIVSIDFKTIFADDTNSWLIYNPDSNTIPSPLYRVRFIGESSWAGVGKTGHVVGGNINKKKNGRMEK